MSTPGVEEPSPGPLTFAFVGGLIQDGLGGHDFAVSVRETTENQHKKNRMSGKRNGWNPRRPCPPRTDYRCTHQPTSGVTEQLVCPRPCLEGGGGAVGAKKHRFPWPLRSDGASCSPKLLKHNVRGASEEPDCKSVALEMTARDRVRREDKRALGLCS